MQTTSEQSVVALKEAKAKLEKLNIPFISWVFAWCL